MFKEYLEQKGVVFSETGRIERCPICDGEHTAQYYKDNDKLVCFRGSCEIAIKYPSGISLNEYKKVFEGIEDVKTIDEEKRSKIFEEAIRYFHDRLIDSDEALNYLKQRGRTIESITEFKVGWIQETDKLYNRLKNIYSDDELEGSGLFKYNDNGPYLALPQYVYCYPIYNNEGRVVNIKTKKDKEGLYISKKYTGDFIKFLNTQALKEEEIILVEGENDCMRLWEMGKKNTVAVLGQLSSSQIQYIKGLRNIKKIFICFDNDDAGKNYTLKLIKGLSKTKKQLLVIEYSGKDPDVGEDFYWEGKAVDDIIDELETEMYKPISNELEEKYAKVLISSKVRYIMKSRPFDVWLDKWNLIQYDSKYDESIIESWMRNTHCYSGTMVNFKYPKQNVNDRFNLFYGFQIQPEKKIDITSIYDHIKNILCSGDSIIYEYLMDWIAHMFQRPYEVVGTAPVFISKQGAGKGIIIEHLLGKIIGQNYFVSSGNGDNFTNSFNSIIEGKLLINVDEASFSGNHQETGIFKKIIGNETSYIVRKGYEGYSIENRARMIIGSQHDTAVKIEKSNRRFFVPIVDNRYVYKENILPHSEIQKYFIKLYNLIDNGGRETFLYDMMQRDISGFNRFIPPTSKKEREMAALDVDNFESWFWGSITEEVPDDANWTKDGIFTKHQILRSSIVFGLFKKCFPKDEYMKPIGLSQRISKTLSVDGSNLFKIEGKVIRGWKVDMDKLTEATSTILNDEFEEKPAYKGRVFEYLKKLNISLDDN